MSQVAQSFSVRSSEGVFCGQSESAVPIYLCQQGVEPDSFPRMTAAQRRWVEVCGFRGQRHRHLLVPGEDGAIDAVLLGTGDGVLADPCGPVEYLIGDLAKKLPPLVYQLEEAIERPADAAVAWGLGSYVFDQYKSSEIKNRAQLSVISDRDAKRAAAIVDGVWLGRDLINAPANDMGPAELEEVARTVASRRGATFSSIVGEELATKNFPLIYAIGRASPRAPRLIDISWGRSDAPKVTLIGKGICFDTGGLDIKPANAMQLMKKDMGGAASVLALADMVMALGVDVRLRAILAVAENSISGAAVRPGDILPSRAGYQVEIGNTDAEGRLVLADALDLADAETPDLLVTFATLTGAARVALGPDLPAMFATDDVLARDIEIAGSDAADPVWRLPFWSGYDRNLEHGAGDFNNISEGGFGGAITAALFLKRFVSKTNRYVHFDLYGWRSAAKPLGPKGGEPHVARAMLQVIEAMS
ncbi:MAG: leucyl aminopeptidase family protein [Hyphomicrobiaceae bacterium]